MYSAYKLNKQGDNIQPWCTPFPIWNQSVVPCPCLTCFLTCIQVSQDAGNTRREIYFCQGGKRRSHLFGRWFFWGVKRASEVRADTSGNRSGWRCKWWIIRKDCIPQPFLQLSLAVWLISGQWDISRSFLKKLEKFLQGNGLSWVNLSSLFSLFCSLECGWFSWSSSSHSEIKRCLWRWKPRVRIIKQIKRSSLGFWWLLSHCIPYKSSLLSLKMFIYWIKTNIF